MLEEPNEYTDGALLWMALAFAFKCDGHGYWLKERNGSGMVLGVWYEPNTTIRPMWNSDRPTPRDDFISHYELYRSNEWRRIEKDDVIHFKYAINPRNPRQGIPTLMSALREVMTDNEAASYSASLLHNTGIAGAIISPKGDMDFDDPEGVKQAYMEKTQGDRRGEPLVMTVPTDVQIPAFSPEQMVITALRRLPEERITALLRTPAVVAGLGAGLDRMIYNNYSEAREHFMEGSIIPMQSLWARVLTTRLLRSEFGGKNNEYVDFDYTNVRVLQDDENKKAQRWATLYNAGIAKRSEARSAFNLDTVPEDEEYKAASAPGVPTPNMAPLDPDAILEPVEPKMLARNGNGHR
jgi:HK97 family phage portal protein